MEEFPSLCNRDNKSIFTSLGVQKWNAAVFKVLENMDKGFAVLNHEWCFIYINLYTEQLIGLDKVDILGKNIWQIFPDIIGNNFYNNFHKAMLTQQPVSFEFFCQANQCWYDLHLSPSDEGLFISCTDISQHKQEEVQAFRLLDALPHMVCVMKPDGSITYINKQWTDWTGLRLEDMQHNGWRQIFHPDDLVQAQIDWREALHHQREYVGKFRLKNPQGGYTWFIGKTALLTNQRGEILNLAVTCTNIDELKGL